MNYSEFRFHVTQRYVRDVWIEYRLADQSCVIHAEFKSGEVKPLMLSNADCVHRYKSCDNAIKTIVNSGWVRTLRVQLGKQKIGLIARPELKSREYGQTDGPRQSKGYNPSKHSDGCTR